MNKFVLKFFIIFAVAISALFFSLISFNERQMEKMVPEVPVSLDYFETHEHPPLPPEVPEPPSSIPLVLIALLSTGFIWIFLKYLDKNFIKPLDIIEKNIQKIKEGNLDIEFKAKSENKNIENTFCVLNEMVQELQQKEKLQNNFIQNLVHDLRAPVIAQERAIEILSEELEGHELVEGMIENNDAYLKMINNIIETLRLKEIKIEKTNINFSKLTDTIISALKPAIDAKKITIKKSFDENFTLWADYISLNRIVLNLISNAVENIDEKSTITISAQSKNDRTTITIEDNGRGVSEEEIKVIFTKYKSNGKSAKKSSSGLGLSIVEELVNKNDGSIKASSVQNEYMKFTIELPNRYKNEKA